MDEYIYIYEGGRLSRGDNLWSISNNNFLESNNSGVEEEDIRISGMSGLAGGSLEYQLSNGNSHSLCLHEDSTPPASSPAYPSALPASPPSLFPSPSTYPLLHSYRTSSVLFSNYFIDVSNYLSYVQESFD